jgi:hypothetical protein
LRDYRWQPCLSELWAPKVATRRHRSWAVRLEFSGNFCPPKVVLAEWESEQIRAERMPRDEGQEFAQGAEAEEGNGRSPARTEGIPSEQAKPALEGSPGLTSTSITGKAR